MRNLSLALAAALLLVSPAALARKPPAAAKELVVKEQPAGDLYATLQTSLGVIIVKLYEKEAPKTVENFVGLATGKKEWKHPATGKWSEGAPLYDGTAFHRVIPRFMIQGGDPNSRADGNARDAGRGGPGYRFEDEVGSGLRFNRPGLLAMANSGPNTNGSQFFITEVPTPHLDGKHTIFGEVVSGFELVPRIVAAGNMEVRLVKVAVARGSLVPAPKAGKAAKGK
jgi:peptidyl-prolyl cis-trans isomerase A (cyclophilin A)